MNRFFASASVILVLNAGCLFHVFVRGLPARATEPAITGAAVVPLEIPPARRVAVPLAPFLATSPTFEDAFAAAVAAAADRVSAERAAGGEAVRAVVELPPGRHCIGRPLRIDGRNDLGIDGGGCTLVQTAVDEVFEITACRNVVISNLTIDYYPLPFTQGTVVAINGNGKTIDVEVDRGYPCDPTFAARLSRGCFQVMDREQESFAIGGRYAMHPTAAEVIADGIIRVEMAWGVNELGPGQRPLAVGDVVTLLAFGPVAIAVRASEGISFSQCRIHASPRFGMVFLGGGGGTVLDRVHLVPGPPPAGADQPRLCCTNADGTHFNSVMRGPTITDCVYRLTADDPVNVHGGFSYVVERLGPRTLALSPRSDLGLEGRRHDRRLRWGSVRREGEGRRRGKEGQAVGWSRGGDRDRVAAEIAHDGEAVVRGHARSRPRSFRRRCGVVSDPHRRRDRDPRLVVSWRGTRDGEGPRRGH